jgi:SAM-dependent methyltransferase
MTDVEALQQQITWLKMDLDQMKREEQQFTSESGYHGGTGFLARVVPPIAPYSLRATVSSSSMAGYLITADAWYFAVSQYLKENACVMDIGCGCGKMARILLGHPYVIKYIGFDNYELSIKWCQETLTPISPERLQFHYFDIYSKAYNPSGALKGTEVAFPAGNESVDLVFAASLFTHLVEDDCVHYLRETKRILKKDGAFLPSIHSEPAAGTRFSGDEVRIDIDPQYFIELAEKAGLQLVEQLGTICGQDLLLFRP